MEDADKAATIFLGILLVVPLMFLLLAAIAESTPGNSPLKKFLNSFFDTFQGKNRYSLKRTPNPVITKKEKVSKKEMGSFRQVLFGYHCVTGK